MHRAELFIYGARLKQMAVSPPLLKLLSLKALEQIKLLLQLKTWKGLEGIHVEIKILVFYCREMCSCGASAINLTLRRSQIAFTLS